MSFVMTQNSSLVLFTLVVVLFEGGLVNSTMINPPYFLMGLNVHNNFLRLIRDGGKWEDGYLCPTTYSLHCHHQNDSALRRAAV